jgi:hypothetical protein
MIESRESARLTQQSIATRGREAHLVSDGLQRDSTLQALIEAEVDLPHAALSKEGVNANATDAGADHCDIRPENRRPCYFPQ